MSDRTQWTPQAHQDLLVAIMTKITLTEAEWNKIAPELQAKGYSYTLKAAVYASHRLSHLRGNTLDLFPVSKRGPFPFPFPFPKTILPPAVLPSFHRTQPELIIL